MAEQELDLVSKLNPEEKAVEEFCRVFATNFFALGNRHFLSPRKTSESFSGPKKSYKRFFRFQICRSKLRGIKPELGNKCLII